ncbi:hypothetical protein STEG23_035153 [Scotinomys teguina]
MVGGRGEEGPGTKWWWTVPMCPQCMFGDNHNMVNAFNGNTRAEQADLCEFEASLVYKTYDIKVRPEKKLGDRFSMSPNPSLSCHPPTPKLP